mgnify:FL=1
MAAAAPDRASFGCANTERNTWFVQALATALQAARPPGAESLDTLWQRTLAEVSRLEAVRRVGPPSQPLSWVGPQMTRRFHAAVADF